MNRFYVIIRFLPEEKDNAFLAGRCIQELHGLIKRFEISSVGVSFPLWSIESLGCELVFVSTSNEILSILIKQNYFKEMERRKFFSLSPISMVQEQDNQDVYFIRDQRLAKLSPGRLFRDVKRAKRRARERGELYVAQHSTLPSDIFDIHFHQIPLHSNSNGNKFYIYIQRISAQKACNKFGFNSYGLSLKGENKASVPIIFNN